MKHLLKWFQVFGLVLFVAAVLVVVAVFVLAKSSSSDEPSEQQRIEDLREGFVE